MFLFAVGADSITTELIKQGHNARTSDRRCTVGWVSLDVVLQRCMVMSPSEQSL